ncbi:MAG: cytochrome B [Proteobacteria bacterium]|nr:cytochrome B [Pseudomonadota bacterium]
MVLGWGLLLPTGALAARYFKRTRRWPERLDHKGWWIAHRLLQWSGMAAAALGLAWAWGRGAGGGALAPWHHFAGWSLMAIGLFQIGFGLVRGSKGGPTDVQMRGDHYDMSTRRVWFERLHKSLGWLAMLLSMAVIASGLVLADAPRWMPLVLATWWLALAAAAWRWQRAGRCIDTYQAIWGPDPAHPGNRRAPIGWGVNRPLQPRQRR